MPYHSEIRVTTRFQSHYPVKVMTQLGTMSPGQHQEMSTVPQHSAGQQASLTLGLGAKVDVQAWRMRIGLPSTALGWHIAGEDWMGQEEDNLGLQLCPR